MKVAYLTNSSLYTGVGYQSNQIRQRLARPESKLKLFSFHLDGQQAVLSKNGRPVGWLHQWPRPLAVKSINWIRLGRKLNRYIKKIDQNTYSGYHATNQTLSFLQSNFHPMVITVHDLIELTDPQTKSAAILSRYLYRGIKQAEHLIAVSKYTARQIIDYYHLPPSKISVIYNGVGDDYFPIPGFSGSIANTILRRDLKLADSSPVLLFVGSDHPRKNLSAAVEAFARARRQLPSLVFIKVGEPGLPSYRLRLLDQIDRLSLRAHVRLLSNIPTAKLNEFYNLSSALIFPSRHEGFGLPPLQAMAAGTPVIAANSTSIPEIVGHAAILHHPDDIAGLADSIVNVIKQNDLAQKYISLGLARSRQFSWQTSANQVLDVYNKTFTGHL